jgi:hypothetical protein
MASMALLVAQMGSGIPVHVGPSKPPEPKKPSKDRSKVKAARKQRMKGDRT